MPRGRQKQQGGRGRRGGGATRGRGRGGLGGGRAPLPFDSRAASESAALGNEGSDTRASLDARYNRIQSKLGVGIGADNPYSETAQNKEHLGNRQRGINSAAGNQLYSGSTVNAQSGARSEYDKRQKEIDDTFAEEQSAHDSGIAQTNRDEAVGMTAIKGAAVDRAVASEPAPLAVGSRRSGRGRQTGRGRSGGGAGTRKRSRGRV